MSSINWAAVFHMPWLEYRHILPDGRICLIADRIREYKGYVPVVIDDAATGAAHVLEEGQFDFGQHLKRHGGVVAITQEAYQALLKG